VTTTPDDSTQRQLLKLAEAIAQLRRAVEALETETTNALADFMARVEEVEDAASQPVAGTVSSWVDHPEVVEEVTALWLAWQAAYVERDAPLTAAAEWHDRWLPGVLHRLEHGPFALDCGTCHKPRPEALYAAAETCPGTSSG